MTEGSQRDDIEHVVTVLPRGLSFRAQHGETVFAAARRNGLSWPTRCLGRAACRQCYLEVDDANLEALSLPSRLETDALKRVIMEPMPGLHTRLACQAKVLSDVEVNRAGVHLASGSPPAQPLQNQSE
jgi:2Fe-2S ferredoxin